MERGPNQRLGLYTYGAQDTQCTRGRGQRGEWECLSRDRLVPWCKFAIYFSLSPGLIAAYIIRRSQQPTNSEPTLKFDKTSSQLVPSITLWIRTSGLLNHRRLGLSSPFRETHWLILLRNRPVVAIAIDMGGYVGPYAWMIGNIRENPLINSFPPAGSSATSEPRDHLFWARYPSVDRLVRILCIHRVVMLTISIL